MLTPAVLFKESLNKWPEPLSSICLTPHDWQEFANLCVANPISSKTNIGLQLVSCIEQNGLTASRFKDGGEYLFVFAFNSLADSRDIKRILKFHKLHSKDLVKLISNDPNIMSQVEAFTKSLNQGNTQ